jgi:hypothetical protein
MELHVCQSFFLSLFNFLRNSSLHSFYFLCVSLSGKQRHLFIILWRFKNLYWRSHRVKYLPRSGFWSLCKLSYVLLLRCGEIVVRLAPCCLARALEWSCWHVMAQKHLSEIRMSSIVTSVVRWTASSVSVYINSADPTGWIYVKFSTGGDFYIKICQEYPRLDKTWEFTWRYVTDEHVTMLR